MTARLVVSLSGVRDTTLAHAERFAARLAAAEVPYSLLVAPRAPGGWRLSRDEDTRQFLLSQQAHGRVLLLNGYDISAGKKRRAEFATLGAHEARLRLTAARRQLAHCGVDTHYFAPPRWVASPGAREAAPQVGFTLLAELNRVDVFQPHRVVEARVVAFGEGFGARRPWRRSAHHTVERILERGGIVRLSIDAKHLADAQRRAEFIDLVDLARSAGATPWDYHQLAQYAQNS